MTTSLHLIPQLTRRKPRKPSPLFRLPPDRLRSLIKWLRCGMSYRDALKRIDNWGLKVNKRVISEFWLQAGMPMPKINAAKPIRPGKVVMAFELRTGKAGGLVLKITSNQGFKICPKPDRIPGLNQKRIQDRVCRCAIIGRFTLPKVEQDRIDFLESRMREISQAKYPYHGAIAAAAKHPRFACKSYLRLHAAWMTSGKHWSSLMDLSKHPTLWARKTA